MTTKNVQVGFRATRLVLYNPESVISCLDPKLITLLLLVSCSETSNSWVTKISQILYNINQQSITIKNKIAKHQNSSLTHMYNIINAQAHSMSKIAHKLVLLQLELKNVQAANEVLRECQKAKKTCLQQGGSLSFQEAVDLVAKKEVDKQIKEKTCCGSDCTKGAEPCAQRYGTCGNVGHNTRTCQVEVVTFEEDNSE